MSISITSFEGDAHDARYTEWVRTHPQGNLWQSPQWAAYQRAMGRGTRIYIAEYDGKIVASGLIIIDRTAGGYATWDCMRGPLMSDKRLAVSGQHDVFLERIIADAKQERCIALYCSSAVQLTTDHCLLTTSPRHEQPLATIVLDLTQSEDSLLAQMHQKGRYNIKVAQKHGVIIRESRDIDAFYQLLQTTGERDGFGIGPKERYEAFLRSLDGSFLCMATLNGKPIAGLLGVIYGKTAIYYYGASSSVDRKYMAPYLLQWEAMRLAKSKGCTRYDLLGIDPPGQTSAWAGVTEFKRKFGGTVIEYPPEQMLTIRPWVHRGLQMKRKIFG